MIDTAGGEILLYCTVIRQGGGDGIYRFRFDETRGQLSAAEKESSFPAVALAIRGRDRLLYAAEERRGGCRIRAYSIGPEGSLTPKAQSEYGFSGISHLSVSRDGRLLWVAASGCGGIAAVSLREGCPSDVAAWKAFPGHGANRERQEASHPHFVLETEEGALFVPDLGTDRIHRLRLTQTPGGASFQCLGETELPAGSGPRHMARNGANGEYYLVTELGSELFRYAWDARNGELVCRQRQSLRTGGGARNNLAADVRVFAGGSKLMASSRGENEIRVFRVDRSSGALSLSRRIRTDGWPRNVRADETGRWIFASNETFEDSRGSLEIFDEEGTRVCQEPLDGAYAMELFFEKEGIR